MGIDIPLISIAMATYNGEKYLKAQLDSIYAQTYKNIEVIVCDDCSSDKTVEILEDYSKKFGLKYFVNETNLGFVKNFEKAVNLCRGDYIALSDQDDIWLPHKLSTLIENIGDNILACSDAKLIDEKNNIISESFFQYSNKPINEELTFEKLAIRNYVTGCTVLMKNKILQNAHPIPLNISYHDWWYGLIASVVGGIYLHKESLILYRQHQDNHTGAKNSRYISTTARVKNMFNGGYLLERKKKGAMIADRLKNFKIDQISNRFSYNENKILDDLILYYQSWGNGFIHIKAFFVALKYINSIYYYLPKKLRYFACFRALFL